MSTRPRLLAALTLAAALVGSGIDSTGAFAQSAGPGTSAAKATLHPVVKHPVVVKKAGHPATLSARKVPAKVSVAHAATHIQARGGVAPAQVVLSPVEARLVTLVNQTRTQAGLHALVVEPGTTDVARAWSLQLAEAGTLSHNPKLAVSLQNAGSNAWQFLAENVGTGPADDADMLFQAYMNSEHHRENILDPRAVYIGMGAIEVPGEYGDTLWNTMDFVDAYSTAYGANHTRSINTVVPLSSAPRLLYH